MWGYPNLLNPPRKKSRDSWKKSKSFSPLKAGESPPNLIPPMCAKARTWESIQNNVSIQTPNFQDETRHAVALARPEKL